MKETVKDAKPDLKTSTVRAKIIVTMARIETTWPRCANLTLICLPDKDLIFCK